MVAEDAKNAFIRVLEKDAAQFDRMADNLERITSHMVAEHYGEMARAQIEYRRSLAKQLRILIELVRHSQQ
jgi:hypothetical protein